MNIAIINDVSHKNVSRLFPAMTERVRRMDGWNKFYLLTRGTMASDGTMWNGEKLVLFYETSKDISLQMGVELSVCFFFVGGQSELSWTRAAVERAK